MHFFQDGYRYILAEQDSNAPLANMDMEFWAGKPIPGDLYRIKLHKEVLLSMNDRGLYKCLNGPQPLKSELLSRAVNKDYNL